MNKYPEDKRFGEWTPEQRREFKIDTNWSATNCSRLGR